MTQHIWAPNTKPFFLLLLLSSVILLFAPWSSVGPATEAAAPLYQGYHDYVDCNYIAGWVRDQNSSSTRLNVTARVFTTTLITARR